MALLFPSTFVYRSSQPELGDNVRQVTLMTNLAEHSSVAEVSSPPPPFPGGPVYSSAWRGILLVEPDITLLTAEVLLFTRLNYCVTPAFSQGEIFALRDTKPIALAILSDSLGSRILAAVAQTVRKQWPLARILILGRPQSVLDDHLYDEEIGHASDPKTLIEGVETLYKGSWNQRSHTLDWDVKRSGSFGARSLVRESDPTKLSPLNTIDETLLRGTPSDIRYRPR